MPQDDAPACAQARAVRLGLRRGSFASGALAGLLAHDAWRSVAELDLADADAQGGAGGLSLTRALEAMPTLRSVTLSPAFMDARVVDAFRACANIAVRCSGD